MPDSITNNDLKIALERHVESLKSADIKYNGHLVMDHGSKHYGRAYRLALTGYKYPCFARQAESGSGIAATRHWDHANCTNCNGSKQIIGTGHSNPPVGSDYLGMTKREAYDTLIDRTNVINDVVYQRSNVHLLRSN